MIAAWMMYALLVGTLIGGAAFIAERGVRAMGWPGRWIWVAAIGLTLLVPTVGMLVPRERPIAAAPALEVELADAPGAAASWTPSGVHEPGLIERIAATISAVAPRLDLPLLLLWALGTTAMLGTVVIASVRLSRVRRAWSLATVGEQFVRVSADVGPAVVGWRCGEIVLPEWALRMPATGLAMLLAHEREHLRARDPLLLIGGLGALVLVPWNLAVWWQVRRLRLAVEMDCDRRVLRGGGDVRAYGALLIEVGRRTARAPLAAAAFSEPATHLERRIRMMLARPPRWRVLRAATLALAGTLVVAIACDMNPPMAPVPEGEVDAALLGANGKSYNLRASRNSEGVWAALQAHHPELLSGDVEGTWVVQFFVNSQGEILRSSKIRQATMVPTRERTLEERPNIILLSDLASTRERAATVAPTRRAMSAADREQVQRRMEAISAELDQLIEDSRSETSPEVRRQLAMSRDALATERSALEATLSGLALEFRSRRLALTADTLVMEVPAARTRVSGVLTPTERARSDVEETGSRLRRAEGGLLEFRATTAPEGLERVRAEDVESIEVIKSRALGLPPSINGVIWIQLKDPQGR